jgi:hypothetical protein
MRRGFASDDQPLSGRVEIVKMELFLSGPTIVQVAFQTEIYAAKRHLRPRNFALIEQRDFETLRACAEIEIQQFGAK